MPGLAHHQPKAAEQDFVVRENTTVHLVIGLLFFIPVLATFVNDGGTSPAILILLLPSVFCFANAAKGPREVIRINAAGLHHYGRRVTTWEAFVHVRLSQREKPESLQDDFILLIRYRRDGGIYERTIPLTNSQDKAEEEILAAIRSFHERSVAKS